MPPDGKARRFLLTNMLIDYKIYDSSTNLNVRDQATLLF
jgi:hypothetical protein